MRRLALLLVLVACSKGDDPPAASDTDVVAHTDVVDTDLAGCALAPTHPRCVDCCLDGSPKASVDALVISLLGGCACVQGGAACTEACAAEIDPCDGSAISEACTNCLVGVLRVGTDQCLDVAFDLCRTEAPDFCEIAQGCAAACP